MSETMTKVALETRVRELESYQAWQGALTERRELAREIPKKLDTGNRGHLEAQMRLVDATEVEDTARAGLIVEIAKQDDEFAPVVHRLGLLAVFDRFKQDEEGFGINMRELTLRKEDRIQPSHNLIQRAIQIADELTALKAELEKEAPVPVAMVENCYCMSCKTDYSLVAGGKIIDTEHALTTEPPTVTTEGDQQKVEYKVPVVLFGVVEPQSFRGHRAVGFYSSEPEKYSAEERKKGEINPYIPRIIRLIGGTKNFNRIDALYLGDKALERLQRAELRERALTSPPSSERPRRRRPGPAYRRRMF